MRQCFGNMAAVTVEMPVIAIMHQDNVSQAHERQPADHTLGQLRLPVVAEPGPHHHARKAQTAHHTIHLRPAKPKRRAHEFHGTFRFRMPNRL